MGLGCLELSAGMFLPGRYVSVNLAKPLWLQSSCQDSLGTKLQVFLGAAPADSKISEVPGSSEKPFPLILLEKFSVPFLPFEEAGMKLGMGYIPFLIDTREDLDFKEVSTNCPDGQVIKSGMAKFLQSAIKPNQRNEFKTWSKLHLACPQTSCRRHSRRR